jgi:hypothetical protein
MSSDDPREMRISRMIWRVARAVRGNLVAWLALFLALAGTGVAASGYVITSTNQIKPSVLTQLQGGGSTAVAAKAAKVPTAIIHRIRSAGPVTTVSEPREGPFESPPVPLTGATWTQEANQANAVIGEATITSPSVAQCGESRIANIEAFDGRTSGEVELSQEDLESESEATANYKFVWQTGGAREASTTWTLESGTAVSHMLSVRASDDCTNGGHFKIDSIEFDVLGFR